MTRALTDTAIVTADLDMCITYLNPGAEKLFGRTQEEAVGRTITEMHELHDVAPDKLKRAIEVIRTTGQYCFTHSFDAGSGIGPRHIEFRLEGIFNSQGEMVGFSMFGWDITERNSIERTLQNEHLRFVTVMDSMDAVVYVADMQTYEILFANRTVYDLCGDVTGGVCWQKLQVGQTGPCSFCTNHRLLDANGRPTEPYVWEFQNTATMRWFQCRDQAIPWPDGRIVRIEIATDITERKLAVEEIKKRERYLIGLNESAQLLLVPAESIPYQGFLDRIGPAADASHAFIFMNHPGPNGDLIMSQKAEWCAEGITSKIDCSAFRDISYSQLSQYWQNIVKKMEIVNGCVADFPERERKILEPQGVLTILMIPIMVEDDFAGFMGFDNCVSDREWDDVEQTFLCAAASDLAQAIRRAHSEGKVRASLREKEVLLREIHHRVKNNMQQVTSLLNLQARKMTDRKALDAIRESQRRIGVISQVHEALYLSSDLSRISMDKYLTGVLREIVSLHSYMKDSISYHIDARDITLTITDAIPVGLIISELVTNAFKHAFPGEQAGLIRIVIRKTGDGIIELTVADDGVGISGEVDVNDTKTLGLQIVNNLVKIQLDGTIDVNRIKGTVFNIKFKQSGDRESRSYQAGGMGRG